MPKPFRWRLDSPPDVIDLSDRYWREIRLPVHEARTLANMGSCVVRHREVVAVETLDDQQVQG